MTPDVPPPLSDVDAVHDIETARMALRWALERLQKLENDKRVAEAELAQTRGALAKSVDEQDALRRTLASQSAGDEQRELYFRKLEEFLNLSLEGKLDASAVARRELENQGLKAALDQRLVQAEQELAARRSALERELEQARQELERSARERSRALEQSYESRRRALEQEHLILMTAGREKELQLKTEEKALAERQAHLQEYYAVQRAELEAQLKHFRAEIEAEVRLRTDLAERMLEERHASLEGGWRRERELLIRELESWKLRAQELTPKIIELEKQLAAAEESARQARGASDAKTLVYEEQRRGFQALEAIWADERRLMKEELERWRSGVVKG